MIRKYFVRVVPVKLEWKFGSIWLSKANYDIELFRTKSYIFGFWDEMEKGQNYIRVHLLAFFICNKCI